MCFRIIFLRLSLILVQYDPQLSVHNFIYIKYLLKFELMHLIWVEKETLPPVIFENLHSHSVTVFPLPSFLIRRTGIPQRK